jgi:hypothetical protein
LDNFDYTRLKRTLKIKNNIYNVDIIITVTLEGTLSILLLSEIELFQLSDTDNNSDIRYILVNLIYTSKMFVYSFSVNRSVRSSPDRSVDILSSLHHSRGYWAGGRPLPVCVVAKQKECNLR